MTGLKDPLHAGQHRETEPGELGPAMIDHLTIDRAQDALGDRRGTWNLKKMPPSGVTVQVQHHMAPKFSINIDGPAARKGMKRAQ